MIEPDVGDGPGSDASLLLDNQLCFLVYRLHRGITDIYRPILRELGLTYPQYLVMLVLWESEPLAVRQIGERLQLDSGTLSPLLKRLEASGLIFRVRSGFDERVVKVSLTAEGQALRHRAREVPTRIGACLSTTPEDYASFRSYLLSMLSRVDAAHT